MLVNNVATCGQAVHPHTACNMMNKDKLQVPRTRHGSKSADNSPFTSPVLSRKVVTSVPLYKQVVRTVDTSKSDKKSVNTNNTSLIDVVSTEDVNPVSKNSLSDCPCGHSDTLSIYVVCTKCKQEWHNRCANLDGIPQASIKKLKNWECPTCYVCPYVNTSEHVSDEFDLTAVKKFLGNMSRIE